MNRNFIQNSNIILRKIFHSNESIDIIKDFIETFLKIKIKNIRINETPVIDGVVSKEYGIVDVRILTLDDREINVGIQIIDGDYIKSKMFLYYAKIHSNQIFYGDKRKIARTITINILDTQYFKTEYYHKVISVKKGIANGNIIEKIEMHLLELPKYTKNEYMDITKEDTWMMYLKGVSKKEINIAKIENIHIKKLDELIKEYWKNEVI